MNFLCSFQGGIILDTVLNLNNEPNSQEVPDSWTNIVPDAKQRIENNAKRGDFLAIIGRNHPNERKMSDLISKWGSVDGLKTQEFNLKKLPPYHEPSIEQLREHTDFWQSDNSRFWFYKEDNDYISFPAVLLTDTGKISHRQVKILKVYFIWKQKSQKLVSTISIIYDVLIICFFTAKS